VHELVRVLVERKGITWVAITAVLYALVLIPFNQAGFVVAGIPVRPAAALPVVLGILLGPAAAFGCAAGNVAGDLFGSWSPMSIAGCLVNFVYPYLSYRLWHRMMKDREIQVDFYSTGTYLVVALVATVTCMLLLAGCGTLLFGRPFESKFAGYVSNNLTWTLTLGTVLFVAVLGPAYRNGCVYGREWERRTGTGPPPGDQTEKTQR
jgi:energy-coupling factor transport system substrate-specific component